MTRPRERDRALQVLEDALSISDEDTDNWVNSIRFSSSNKKIKDLLRKRINAVAPKLGWGSPAWPIIPSSVSLKFLVDALDNSLLECPEVREILVSSLVKTRPDDSLKQLKDIVGGCQNHELPNKVATYDFEPYQEQLHKNHNRHLVHQFQHSRQERH